MCHGSGSRNGVSRLLCTFGTASGTNSPLQFNAMQDLHTHLGGEPWDMRNGYCLPSRTSLDVLNERYSTGVKEEWMSLLRIRIHWNTEVTMNRVSSGHLVHQAYCSAMPVGYSRCCSAMGKSWTSGFEAAYLHTLYAAVQNLQASGVNKVYLTLLGGRCLEITIGSLRQFGRHYNTLNMQVGCGDSQLRSIKSTCTRSDRSMDITE